MANISAQIKTIKNATHDEELREAIAEALTVLADADQSNAVDNLKETLMSLSEKLDSKANSSDVTRIKLTSEEINKLNELKSAINDISRQMSLKANTSDVNKLKKELDGKADSTEVSRALSLKADSTATKSMMNLYSGDGQSALKAAVEEYATETVVNLLRSYTNEQLNLKASQHDFDHIVGTGFQGWTITDYIIRIREDYNTALAEMMTRTEFRAMKAEALEQASNVVSVNDEMDDTTRLYLDIENASGSIDLAEMSDLNALASKYDKYFTFNAPLVFEIGGLDEHGWNATSTVHIRTKEYLEARDFTYTIGTTHSVQVASYDEYKILISRSAWLSGNVSFDIDNIAGIKYIKLVVKRNDEADITSAMLNTFNTSVNTNHLTMFGTDYIGDGEESVASSSLVATKADKDDLEKTANTIAPAYNPSSTYAVEDYVTYNGKLYRCSTAITTAESWTAGHWIESNVGGEISDLKEDLSENVSDLKSASNRLFESISEKTINLYDPRNVIYGWINNSGKIKTDGTQDACVVFVPCEASTIYTIQKSVGERFAIGSSDSYPVVEKTLDNVVYKHDKQSTVYTTANNATYLVAWIWNEATDLSTISLENQLRAVEIVKGSNISGYTSPYSAVDLDIRSSSLKFVRNLNDNEDLNDLYENGWYQSSYSHHYQHSPESDTTEGQRIIKVYSAKKVPSSSTYRVMEYCNLYTGISAKRIFHSNTWHDWIIAPKKSDVDTNNSASLKYIKDLSNNEDLNDLYENGWYQTSYSHHYQHSPESSDAVGQRIIKVYSAKKVPTATTHRIMEYCNLYTGVKAKRLFANGYWSEWIYDSESNMQYESFAPHAVSSQGQNVGTKIRVMSYNVAKYNNDSSEYINDRQVFNFRKMLGEVNADFLCIQEERKWIDNEDAGTKLAKDYLYLPQYPYNNGERSVAGGVIRSKITGTSGTYLELDGARSVRYSTYLIDGKTLLLIATHPVWNYGSTGYDSADSIAIRKTQFQQIFEWANGDISLPTSLDPTVMVSAPTHTHCIICMDGNTSTSTDKTNLQDLAAENGYILGNGGALGWIYTCDLDTDTPYSLDNIMVSENVIINNFDVLVDWFRKLYSDHAPVIADVTLL